MHSAPGAEYDASAFEQPLLECRGLVKDYPGKRAVDGVDFHVHAGEIVGLLGPNGAGKTTSFRMACGLIAPTEGRVTLGGLDVTYWPMYQRARNGMGFLPQNESIFTKLSVEQNLIAILEYMSYTRAERYDEATRLLEQFGLQDKRRQIASTLSGGERRRLEIARCLASRPALILLDEPFTGIDPVTIHGIQDIIQDLREGGISILLTDHRERETLTITDRSYIICAGKVLVSGDAQTVLSDPTAQAKYFGTRFDAESIIESKEAFRQQGRAHREEAYESDAGYDEEACEQEQYDEQAYAGEGEPEDGYYDPNAQHEPGEGWEEDAYGDAPPSDAPPSRRERRRKKRRRGRGDEDRRAA